MCPDPVAEINKEIEQLRGALLSIGRCLAFAHTRGCTDLKDVSATIMDTINTRLEKPKEVVPSKMEWVDWENFMEEHGHVTSLVVLDLATTNKLTLDDLRASGDYLQKVLAQLLCLIPDNEVKQWVRNQYHKRDMGLRKFNNSAYATVEGWQPPTPPTPPKELIGREWLLSLPGGSIVHCGNAVVCIAEGGSYDKTNETRDPKNRLRFMEIVDNCVHEGQEDTINVIPAGSQLTVDYMSPSNSKIIWPEGNTNANDTQTD